jgi:hypothetical protein
VKPQKPPSNTHPQVVELVEPHVMPAGHGPPQKPEASGVPHTGIVVEVVEVVVETVVEVVVVVLVVGSPAGAQRSDDVFGVTVRVANWSATVTGGSFALGHLSL